MRRLGPRSALINPIVGTVFPNFSLLRAAAHTFRIWHPRGLDKVEIWSWSYVDKAASPAIKAAFRLASLRSFSPAGAFEQDDMDNWHACTQTCRGVVSRRYPFHYAMGRGHEGFNEDLLAWASDFRISESNHRHFYQRWGQLMAAKNWAAV